MGVNVFQRPPIAWIAAVAAAATTPHGSRLDAMLRGKVGHSQTGQWSLTMEYYGIYYGHLWTMDYGVYWPPSNLGSTTQGFSVGKMLEAASRRL